MKSLNHIYRTIWSDALGAWIAVSEITRCKGKRSASSLIRTIAVASGHQTHEGNAQQLRLKPVLIAIACCFALNAQANPVGGQVVNGNASFNTSGNTLTVINTPGTIINWQNFSIGANETTHFAQQSAASTVLNRVVTNNPSAILGTLSSNGQVYLVNSNGIMFGAGSTVDVAGLVATTLNLSDADFLAGKHNYTAVTGAGDVSNAGNINAQQAGYIYLIAPNVENTGIITAPNGEILLAAGNSVQLVNSLDPSLRVSITAPAGNATNLGRLIAQSGSLGLFGTMVKSSGTVSADSAVSQGGKIVFKSSQGTVVGGTVSATGSSGGSIEVLGSNDVQVAAGANIDASGINGGGSVLVGGDAHGANPNVVNAKTTYVDAAATIRADATQNGNGGRAIVWSDHATQAYGSITARGGTNGGNGGFVETSGHLLGVNGIQVDASAPHGNAGEWLLDPWNVTIGATGASVGGLFSGSPPGIWNPNATGSFVNSGTVASMLTAGTNVTINTTGAGAELGDITVNGAIAATAPVNGVTLTLNAAHNIIINQAISTAGANALNLVLNHNDANGYAAGTTSVTLANTLTLGAGNLTIYDGLGSVSAPPFGTLNVTGGATNFTGILGISVLNISGGTNSFAGTIAVGTGGSTLNTISVSGGTTNFSSAPVITGAISIPNVSMTGGTLNLNTSTGTTITNLSLSGTGTLGGTSAVTMGTGTFFNWYGGTVALTGTGSLTLAAGSTTTLNAGTLSLTGTMTNNGTMSQQSVNGGLTTALNVVGGTFTNSGTLNIGNATAGAFTLNASNGGSFTNAAGGIVNSAGAVSNLIAGTFGTAAGTITNTGAVNVATGNTLEWQSGTTTTNSGTYGTATGSTLNITQNGAITGTATYTGAVTNNGTYNLSGGLLTTGALTNNGAATLGMTNTTYSGAYSGTGSLTLAPSGGALHFAPTGVTTLPSLTYNGLGTLYVDIAATINNLTLNGSNFRGAGAITIPNGGSVTSSGASLSGSSAFTISSGATANFSNTWIQRPVTNSGTMNISGISNINSNTSACCADLNNGSLINTSTGVINLTNGWLNPQYGSTFTNNAGGQVIAVSGANKIDATSTFGPTVGTFINNGSVTVNAGASLSIINGGASTNAGTFTTAVAAGALPAGVLDFNMAAAFVPGGTVYTYNGAFTNNGTMTFSGGTYSLTAAIVNNAASPGLFGILTPAVLTDAAGITNGLGATFALSGTFNGAVNNAGTFAHTGTLTGNLTNSGTTSDVGGTITGNVTNTGTLTLGSATVTGTLANNGTGMVITNGTSTVSGAITNSSTAPSAFNVLSATTLNATTGVTNSTGGNFTLAGTLAGPFTNAGTLTQTGTLTGALSNSGTASIGGTTTGNITNTGALTLNAATVTGTLANNGTGTVSTSGTNTVSGAITNASTAANAFNVLSATTLNATTGVTNSTGGNFTLAGTLAGGPFTNAGTLTLSAATVTGTLTNNAGGQIIAASGTNTIDTNSAPIGTFTNNGSVTVNAGSSLSILNGAASTNAGTFTTAAAAGALPGGILDFNTAAGATAGTVYSYSGTFTNNGTMLFSGGTYSLTAAIINNASATGLLGILTPAVLTDTAGITNGASSTFALSGTFNGAVNNAGTFALNGTLNGNLTNSGVTSGTGSTITGNVTNSGAMTMVADTVNGTLNNSGSFLVAGAGTVNGLITNTSTGIIDILGGTAPTLNATAGLDNAGIINLGDPGTSTDTSTLSVTGAALNNTNTINSIGTMGARVLSATTLNNTGGTINISYAMSVNGISYAAGTTIVGTTVNLPPAPVITPPVISELVNVTTFPPKEEDKKNRSVVTVATLAGGDKAQAGLPTLVCQ